MTAPAAAAAGAKSAAAAPRAGGSPLTGTGALVRLAVRRSRILLVAWMAAFVVTAATSSTATVDLYPTLTSRQEAAASLNQSAAIVAFYGRIPEAGSIGAIAIFKLTGLGAVVVALLAIVVVVRHTRGDEEAGRAELVGATVVGRAAPLAAALLVVAGTSVVLGLLTGVAMAGTGLPVAGSFAFGLSWAVVGLAFGAVAAVAAQLTPSARTATALSGAVLAASYVLRGIGDAAGDGGLSVLRWVSPIGWAQQIGPYAGDRWWVAMVPLVFTAVAVAVAFRLATRRDLGTGVLPVRAGPRHASRWLRSNLALAWRLQRVSLLGWAIGFAVVGGLLGTLATDAASFITSPEAKQFFVLLGGDKELADAMLAVELAFAGIAASAYGIQVITHLHAEEAALRAEPLLAGPLGRLRWIGGHLAVALGGTTALMLVTGVAAGLALGVRTGDLGRAPTIVGAALVQLPAAWVLVGITVAAFGLAPRFTQLGWVALAAFVLIGELGPLLHVRQWVLDLSPFAHTPRLPGGDLAVGSVVGLLAVATALVAVGLAALRRRDVL
ncbi:MAG: hypothetical protein U0Q07_14175 [Acidimicrobiales bacterium]